MLFVQPINVQFLQANVRFVIVCRIKNNHTGKLGHIYCYTLSMKGFCLCLLLTGFFGISEASAQIFSLGMKQDRRPMFQAALNLPLVFDNDKNYDFTVGVDYTSENPRQPSGLAPQVGFVRYIVDNRYKDFLVSANVQTGYLFDFNKGIDNQFRVSPHLYVEYQGFFHCRVGYDYAMPLQKGYPFVSIGIGGLMMFRHFSIM